MKKLLVFVGALAIPGCFERSGRPGGNIPPTRGQAAVEVNVENGVATLVRPTGNAKVVHVTPEATTPDVTPGDFGSVVAKAHPQEAKAMLAAAQKTWEANKASYDVGTTTLSNLHHWSRQLMLAERALADDQEKELAALLDYWKRNKQIYLKVRALYNAGSRGGEIERFGEASYYLAEAELLLKAAGGTVPENLD
jgi:hypothetical protein